MPKKGEKLSDEHKAKMKAGAKKARETGIRKTKPKTLIIPNQVPALPSNPANDEKVIKNPEDAPVAERKGVQSSGETKKMEAQDFIANRNVGPSAAITTQLPGQKEQIKKELKRKLPKLSPVDPNPPEKTIKGLKTNDPKAVEAKAPFSFNALRLLLRT